MLEQEVPCQGAVLVPLARWMGDSCAHFEVMSQFGFDVVLLL